MNFSVLTFGCKVNQGESEDIIADMISNGYIFKSKQDKSETDIFIINSCTVTAESDRKLRQCINKIKRENKSAIIVLTGCMPQAFPEVAKKFLNVEIIIGNSKKYDIPKLIKRYLKDKNRIFDVENARKEKVFKEKFSSLKSERFRAFLKIEDGCDKFCSYCIIPYARGAIRSKSLEEINKDVISLCKNNYQEIVLTGINLSSYGKDLKCGLEDAIEQVCSIEKVKRVRLGSLEPDLTTETFLRKISKQEKFCPQFHLSLQSGSNKILKSMRRKYTKEDYLKLTSLIRNIFPLATFTTDIMVGFPDETQEDFEESLQFIKKVGFLKVHVFPYSIRPGTLAAKFPNQIERETKSKRAKQMIDIASKTSKIVIGSFKDLNFDVLYESLDSDGFYKGYTSNYILVKTKSKKNICGKILKTSIVSIHENYCIGNLI